MFGRLTLLSQKIKICNLKFLIVQVQRTATTEKSGPCPEMGTRTRLDNSFDNNMVKSQTAMDKNSEPTPIHSNLAE